MNTFSVILLAAVFCIVQIILLKKEKKKWTKYLPTMIGSIGVFIGLVSYFIFYIPFALNMTSQSVLSENQYFALTICVLFTPCLVGSLLGIVIARFLGRKQMLYFLPFIFSILFYLGAVIMGLGMISVEEVAWISFFLVSGLLLSKEKA